MAVKPIPDGYHTATPHLIVRGAARALEFYTKALGAEEVLRLPAPDGTIVHAEIRIGSSMIMMGEEMPGMGFAAPQPGAPVPIALMLYVEDADALFARALAAGGA